jgi:gas vesicle protein
MRWRPLHNAWGLPHVRQRLMQGLRGRTTMTMGGSGEGPQRGAQGEPRAQSERIQDEARAQGERIHAEAERQAERLKEHAHDLKGEAAEAASRAGGAIQSKARSIAEEARRGLADEVTSLARALHASAERLEEEQHRGTARAIHEAASGIERFASGFREEGLETMMHRTESFARRQPALFFGGAVVAGFALTRFLRSSAERQGGYRYDGDRDFTSQRREQGGGLYGQPGGGHTVEPRHHQSTTPPPGEGTRASPYAAASEASAATPSGAASPYGARTASGPSSPGSSRGGSNDGD